MSGAINVVPVDEFLNMLSEKGLVIGKASEFVGNLEFDLQVKRANLRKKKHANLKEILDAKILKHRSKSTLQRWIKSGTIREGEWFKNEKNNQVYIMTSALVRLGYL